MSIRCEECGSRDTTFNERLGEHCCNDCGLVLISEIFEQTVLSQDEKHNHIHSAEIRPLGSITNTGFLNRFNQSSVLPKSVIDGLVHCNMVLTNVAPDMGLKQAVEELYMFFYNRGTFGKVVFEARATAVVYYALLENNTPFTLKEVSSEFPDSLSSARKLIRKMKQLKPSKNLSGNPVFSLSRTVVKITDNAPFAKECEKTLAFFEALIADSYFTKSPSYYGAICWITANKLNHPTLTRKVISEKLEMSENKIWRETKKLLNLIGFSKPQEIRGKTIW